MEKQKDSLLANRHINLTSIDRKYVMLTQDPQDPKSTKYIKRHMSIFTLIRV